MSLNENLYGLKDTQQAILDIMLEIDRVCRANDIPYSLLGGTMLGAVREGGFIPWDDDADLVFSSEALRRFAEVFPQQSPDFTISFTDTWVARAVPRKETNGERPFVDLFHYEPCGNGAGFKCKVLLLKLLQGMLKTDTDYASYSAVYRALLRITHGIGLLFTRNAKLRMYRWVSSHVSRGDGSRLHIADECFHCLAITYPASVAEAYEDISFEGRPLRISSEADAMLTVQYGDYMTPPPESERVPAHVRQREKSGEAQA